MNLTEFIGKIVHIILRSRFKKSTIMLSTPSLVLDVSRQGSLVERWVLQEETLEEHNLYDSTELVLLCQTLFSFINQMPPLKDVDAFNISSLEGQVLASDSSLNFGFDDNAQLRVHKFKSAKTNHGKLYLSVVYDAAKEDSQEAGIPISKEQVNYI